MFHGIVGVGGGPGAACVGAGLGDGDEVGGAPGSRQGWKTLPPTVSVRACDPQSRHRMPGRSPKQYMVLLCRYCSRLGGGVVGSNRYTMGNLLSSMKKSSVRKRTTTRFSWTRWSTS